MSTPSTALIAPDQAPAYLATAGALGNDNMNAETLATPRLYLLQALHDFVIRGNPNYIAGAQAGMFLNSITRQLYTELWVANLFMTRHYSVTKKREFGQKDWRGNFPTVEAAQAKLTADGINLADYDITDTHVHTLAMIDPVEGTILSPIQFSLKGTAVKDSRTWNSNIMTYGASAPRFASIWKLESKLNNNTKGSWYTPQVTFAGWAPDSLFDELRKLYQGLSGRVTIPTDEEVL